MVGKAGRRGESAGSVRFRRYGPRAALFLAVGLLLAGAAAPAPVSAAEKPEIGGWGFDRFRKAAYLEVHVADARLVKARVRKERVRYPIQQGTPPGQYLRVGLFKWLRGAKPPPPKGCFRARVVAINKHGRTRDRQRICDQDMNIPA